MFLGSPNCFISYEVRPVIFSDPEIVWATAGEKPDAWGIYGRLWNQSLKHCLAEHILDCYSREDALSLASKIIGVQSIPLAIFGTDTEDGTLD